MARWMKWLAGILFTLLIFTWFQVQLWRDVWELHQSNSVSEENNRQSRERNARLEHEISELESGLGAIEKEAREELGMIKKGETFFRLIGDVPERDTAGQ